MYLPEAAMIPTWLTTVRWDVVRECMEHNAYVRHIATPLERVAGIIQELVCCRFSVGSFFSAPVLPPLVFIFGGIAGFLVHFHVSPCGHVVALLCLVRLLT